MDEIDPATEFSWTDVVHPFPPPAQQPPNGCLAHALSRTVWLRHILRDGEAIHQPPDVDEFFREIDVPVRPLMSHYLRYCMFLGVPGPVINAPGIRPRSTRIARRWARDIGLIGPTIGSHHHRYLINTYRAFDMTIPAQRLLAREELMQNGPLAGGFIQCNDYPARSDELYVAGGAARMRKGRPLKHMVMIVGCGTSRGGEAYFIYQENYGPSFRGDGYGRMYASAFSAAFATVVNA